MAEEDETVLRVSQAICRADCARNGTPEDVCFQHGPKCVTVQTFIPDARDAIAAMPSPWRPIETAPKDGTEIMTVGLDESRKAIATRWLSPGPFVRGERRSYHKPEGWYWAGWDGAVGPVQPTQWRNLPDPPKL
jgi:hypothetical protein